MNGVPVPVETIVLNRKGADLGSIGPLDDQGAGLSAGLADAFFKLKIVPKQLDIKSAFWTAPRLDLLGADIEEAAMSLVADLITRTFLQRRASLTASCAGRASRGFCPSPCRSGLSCSGRRRRAWG